MALCMAFCSKYADSTYLVLCFACFAQIEHADMKAKLSNRQGNGLTWAMKNPKAAAAMQ